jgi:adenylate cyclase
MLDRVAPEQVERRLAAILAADVAGYSRLMGADEEGTLRTLTLYRGIIADLIDEHRGRIVGTAGDSVLAEFNSAVQAVRTAVAVQRALSRRNADLDQARRMTFRIGINVGDVMVQGSDLLGDGVNVAARLEQMAEPGGILVSRTVWEQLTGKLSFPCTDLGEHAAKNIAHPIRTYRVDWRQPDMVETGRTSRLNAPSLPDKPSIAILPFTNMGSDAEQEYFADGISEDLITAISKWRWLLVIARNTSFTYKGKAIDIKQVGRELGVRYVLEGSVRKAGSRVRITAQLIEAATGTHLWSERYDRDLADTFAVQDEITERVVGAIEPELLLVERQQAVRKSSETLDAWDHYMRGMWWHYQFAAKDAEQAERHMRMAIAADPTYAPGHTGLARILCAKAWFGWTADVAAEAEGAYDAARRAIEIDDRDPYSHYIMANTCLLLGMRERAVAEAQKAIDLTPNFALAYFALGTARIFLGRLDQVDDPFQRAIRLSPHEPLKFFYLNYLGLAKYHQQRYGEAIEILRAGMSVRPFHSQCLTLAACHGQLGQADAAQSALAEMRRLMPAGWDRRWEWVYPYADPVHREQLLEGLRKAGWAG